MRDEEKSREQILNELAQLRQSEIELRASEERWRSLVENPFDFVFIVERNGAYQYVNRTIPGFQIEDLIGKSTAFDHIAPEHHSVVREALEHLFETGNPTQFEAYLPTMGAWLETFVGAVHNDGKIVAASMLSRDITGRKRLEEQLIQSQKFDAIGQLAGGIAHDFNNLLTAITGFTELALMRTAPDSPVSDFLRQASIALERARILVRQLLAFSRHEITAPRVLNLNDFISDVGELLRRIVPENIEITTIPAPDLWMARVDSSQMEQVIVNLSVNARDAMPNGGKLTISTDNVSLVEGHSTQVADIPPGDYVVFTVSDTGTGMTEEVKAHAFEPYFTTKEIDKGSGLGLSTCYGIISQSGGHIMIDSALDKGTTVTAYLPRVAGEPEAARLHSESGYLPTGTETVLVVEDEPMVLEVNAYVLRAQGYTVLEALNGVQALEVAQEYAGKPIHLLFTDVVMPLMSGSHLATEIKKIHPEITVLFTSGYNDDTILRQITLEDEFVFIQKPFTPAILARRVREALDY